MKFPWVNIYMYISTSKEIGRKEKEEGGGKENRHNFMSYSVW